jgi:hypothetical protein
LTTGGRSGLADPEDLEAIAFHEAEHAVVAWELEVPTTVE